MSRRSSPDHRHGRRSTGGARQEIVWGFCSCGWTGSRHLWWAERDAGAVIAAERQEHEAATGHRAAAGFGGANESDDYHVACASFHTLTDDCPVPPDSVSGLVTRVGHGSSTDRSAALDRLAAAEELRAWIEEKEQQAALGCRTAGATWAEMGLAIGGTRQAAFNRWAGLVRRLEAAGLLKSRADDATGTAEEESR